MRVLGLDTTGPYCTVALCDEASVLAYKTEKINRGHAERLAPMVAEVIALAGLTRGLLCLLPRVLPCHVNYLLSVCRLW